MTNEHIRIKVAEACGWKQIPKGKFYSGKWHAGDMWDFKDLPPDFPNDLDACAEMEKTLLNAERRVYIRHLNEIHPLKPFKFIDMELKDFVDVEMDIYMLVSATALQRCEAFLRVKGLWEEGK
jgi:hypothetical protein